MTGKEKKNPLPQYVYISTVCILGIVVAGAASFSLSAGLKPLLSVQTLPAAKAHL